MTKLTKKQINRIAAAAFAAVMATSMTIPAFASGNVLASETPNGLYSSTAGNSNLYTYYQNNQVGSSEGSTSFRIPEAESSSQSNDESYVTTFDKFGESSDPSENIGQDSYVSVIPPETSTSAVDYYDGYDYDADYSTGDVTTEDAGDMTAENSVTTPAEASAEIVGEWFGVLGSSPVNLTLSGDYTYNLNLLDIGETTSGTYTTNGNQVALQLNDGIVMTLEVAADAKYFQQKQIFLQGLALIVIVLLPDAPHDQSPTKEEPSSVVFLISVDSAKTGITCIGSAVMPASTDIIIVKVLFSTFLFLLIFRICFSLQKT